MNEVRFDTFGMWLEAIVEFQKLGIAFNAREVTDDPGPVFYIITLTGH